MFLGLRTVIDPAPDLAAVQEFVMGVLGTAPTLRSAVGVIEHRMSR